MNIYFRPPLALFNGGQPALGNKEQKLVANELCSLLFPAYQPVIEVASGRIQSYEALARYTDQDGELQSAGHCFSSNLLDAAEKRDLDRKLREQALTEGLNLPAGTQLNINISPQWITSLEQTDLIPTLEMIEELGIDPKTVVIELTELNGDLDRILAVVNRYREYGIKIAIDDFGAGFSQLDRVIAFEPDIIKLDMKLFKKASQGGIAETVVESLTRLALRSGAQIVCEGVETVEEFNFGLKCGARYMQGYLFSRATREFLPVDHFCDKVRELRQQFYQQRCQLEQEKIEHIDRIKELIGILKEQLLGSQENTLHVISNHPQSNALIRFYICNREGTQLTPNYNFNQQQGIWEQDDHHQGFNWAWRPYFFQLSAIIPQQPDRLVASPRYQDITSGAPCKTMATLLDQDRVLLVDVLAHWD